MEVFEYTGKGQTVPKDVISVRFHPSVVEVEEKAFIGCDKLKGIVLNDGLEKIGHNAFQRCISLQSITLPSTVIEIGVDAFEGCVSLKEVSLNEGIQIHEGSFANCTSLVTIKLPATISTLYSHTFYNCTSLKEVVLNEGLKLIDLSAFEKCKSLESITLPSTVKIIGDRTFADCIKLREVILHSPIEKLGMDTFHGCSSLERFIFNSISTRLENIIKAGQTDAESKVHEIISISDIEWRDGELFVLSLVALMGEIFLSDSDIMATNLFCGGKARMEAYKTDFKRILRLITYYEMKEATTLFELALWKTNIDQADDANDISRDDYRINVPGPIENIILQYLYPAEQILDWQENGAPSDLPSATDYFERIRFDRDPTPKLRSSEDLTRDDPFLKDLWNMYHCYPRLIP